MVIDRGDQGGRHGARSRLAKATSLVLGIAMFGTVGLSGTLAQEEASAGVADAETIVHRIIAEIFGELFGDGAVADDAAVSGGGDLNVGGSTGSTVTMGGGGGDISIGGGSGGGVTVDDGS